MRCRFVGLILLIPLSGVVWGADFYVDPVRGDDSNDGSATRPWKNLQTLLDRGWIESRFWAALPYGSESELEPKNVGAPIQPGDTIQLRNGFYGDLEIDGHYNTGQITIMAAEGQQPRFRRIRVRSGAYWRLHGLHISPEYGRGETPRTLVDIDSHSWSGPVHDVVVESCVVQSASDVSDWSVEQWNTLASNGVDADGKRVTLRRNRLKNVDSGISVSASHALVEHNSVENFAGDGLRGLGDHSVFQFNTVKNCYDVNDNHDDGFQSWSVGPDGVGSGQVVGIVLRGNTIINYEDPEQPLRGPLQGIGCFDGMYVDWVIENNVILVDHYHGITLLGSRGCRIINNTVADPNSIRPGPPSLRIAAHKRGEDSVDCTLRNNLLAALSVPEGRGMVIDHNLIVTEPNSVFKNLEAADLRLRSGCAAIDAGGVEFAPDTDIAGVSRPQGAGVDIGAHETRR